MLMENNQQINTSGMELENSNTNNLGLPRRSSRKMKPKKFDSRFNYSDHKPKKRPSTNTICNKKNIKMSNLDQFKKKNPVEGKGVLCSVKNCNNRYSNSNILSFFGYPRTREILDIWIENCKIQHLIEPHRKISINLRVCGIHFEDCMFVNAKKKNRLIPEAIPTLFLGNDKCSTTQIIRPKTTISEVKKPLANDTIDNNDMESKSKIKMKSIKLPKNSYIVAPDSISKTQISKIDLEKTDKSCSIPGCTSRYESGSTKIPRLTKSISVFRPSSITVDKWNSILGLQLTVNNVVCEKHFESQDIITRKLFFHHFGLHEIKSLKVGAIPIAIKKNANTSTTKRSLNNDENIIVKKVKTDIKDNSNNNQIDLCDDNTLMPRPTLKSIVLTNKIQSNTQLPRTLVNTSASTSASASKSSSVSASLSNISQSNFRNMNLINNSKLNSSQSSIEKILPKILANSSLSITIPKNLSNKKFSSEIQPINIVDSVGVLKQTSNLNTEHISILPTTSNNISVSSQSSIEKTLSRSLANNCLSITKQSNKLNELIPVIKKKSINSLSNISVVDSTSNTLQSNIKEILKTCLVPTTSQTSIQQNKQLSTINPIEVVDLTITPNIEIKNESTDRISNDNSEDCIITSSYKLDVPSINSNNSSQSMTTSFNHNLSTISTANNSMSNFKKPNESSIIAKDKIKLSNTSVCPEYINNQCFPKSNKASPSYKSTANKTPVIAQCYSLNPNIRLSKDKINFINNETIRSKNLTKTNTSIIREMCKEIILPNLFWKNLYNMNTNITAFIQRNEFMETIKKIYFQNSLVPNIYIKSKRYEFNEAIKTKDELENLLEKIDSIEICLGDDGYYNDKCIGYFDNSSEETELCQSCEDLVTDENLYTVDAMIKDKSNQIKQLKNKISEIQSRVLQARKKEQKKRKIDLRDLFNVINPRDFLSVLRPPEY